MTVRERIREQPLPGEAEAAARSWPVVEAALAEQTPARRARRHGGWRSAWRSWRRPCAWASSRHSHPPAPRSATGSATASPTGPSPRRPPSPACPGVSPYSRSRARAPSRSVRRQLAPARLLRGCGLVAAGAERRGSRRPPRGRRGPGGNAKWSVMRPGRVNHPAWSTGLGFFVAYLEGDVLRERRRRRRGRPPLRRGAAPVTPAWRPHADHVLVYARERGGLEAVDVDSGPTLWRRAGRRHYRVPASSRGRATAGGWWRSRLAS